MEDERLYEIAAKELEVNAPRKGLFARAFADAMGEENKARAIYIKLRVEQLEETLRQQEETLRQQEETHRQQKEERQRKEREAHSAAVREQRQQLADSLKTSSDCENCLTRHGYKIRELCSESWWEPGRWVVRDGRGNESVVCSLEALHQFTREILLSDPSMTPEPSVGTRSGQSIELPAAINAPTRQSGATQPRASDRALRSNQIEPGHVRSGGQSASLAAAPSAQSAARAAPNSPHPEEAEVQSPAGFITRFMNGDFGLPMTYWVYGVLVGTVANVVSYSIMITSPGAFVVLGLALIAYQVLVLIGIWNAADKYAGPLVWAVLARTAVVFGALFVLLALVVIARIASL